MKLVDILARDLKVWPEGFGNILGQCSTGELHSCDESGMPLGLYTKERFSRCDRYMHETVIREQWQAAVDALKAPAWDGEGLPPVGVVCLTEDKGRTFRVKILTYVTLSSGKTAVMCSDDEPGSDWGELHAWLASMCNFRPIRTAEQIKADEREAGIKEMAEFLGSIACDDWVAERALYDAGYRKQVAP